MCSEAEPSRAGTRYRLEVVFRLEVLGTFFYRLLVVEVLETRSPFVLFLSLLEVRLETLTQELVPRLPRGAGTAKPLPPRFLRAWVLVQNMNLSENADDGKRPARTSERGALAVWLAAAVRLVVARCGGREDARFAAPLCRDDSDHLGEGGREDAVTVDGIAQNQCLGLCRARETGKRERRVKSRAPVGCHRAAAPAQRAG